jgi:tRNA-specific adenosine deaminase 1
MELTMAAQEDATPWTPPPTSSPSPSESAICSTTQAPLHGRSYFSELGLVRRKPSRPDAPPTLSKSCSDKLSLKQCTSLLSSTTSLLISPSNIYIKTLVLPSSQLSITAVKRAFSSEGRMAPAFGKDKAWDGGYAFKPFRVLGTEKEFTYSRRQKLGEGEKIVPSNVSASWSPRFSETLIGGTLQGKKQFSLKGASRVCKRRSWKLALEIAKAVSVPAIERALSVGTYKEVKAGEMLAERRKIKEDVREVLGGWVRNEGGEEFYVEGVEA